MTSSSPTPGSEVVARAVELLREHADLIRDCSTDSQGSWAGELESKEDHDKLVRTAADLENLYASSERSAIPQGYCSLHVEASAPCAQAGHCLVEGDLGVQRAIHDRAAPSAIGPSQEAIDFEEASRDHRDAERYRWLLEQWSTHHGAHHVEWRFDIGCAEVYGLEALIDKAMEAK